LIASFSSTANAFRCYDADCRGKNTFRLAAPAFSQALTGGLSLPVPGFITNSENRIGRQKNNFSVLAVPGGSKSNRDEFIFQDVV
jgi:hypothetical protein